MYNNEFIWNPSNCEGECDRSCDIGEYLDYKKLKCRNKTVDKLFEEYSKNYEGNKMLHNETLHAIPLNIIPLNAIPMNAVPLNAKVCNSCTIYMVLFFIFLIIRICISSVFIYFHWYFFKKIIFL